MPALRNIALARSDVPVGGEYGVDVGRETEAIKGPSAPALAHLRQPIRLVQERLDRLRPALGPTRHE